MSRLSHLAFCPAMEMCDFDNYLGDKLDQNWHLTSLKMSFSSAPDGWTAIGQCGDHMTSSLPPTGQIGHPGHILC